MNKKLHKMFIKPSTKISLFIAAGGHQVPEEHALRQEAQQEGTEGGEEGSGRGCSSCPRSGTSNPIDCLPSPSVC